MFIIRILRSLLLIALALVALAIGGAAVAAVEVLFVAVVGLWSPHGCTKTVHQGVAGLSGIDFEISEMGCDLFIKDTTTSVFISKVGGPKRTLLFKYFPPGVDATPTIALLDEHTIQISIWRVPLIFCRKEKWETLTVKYNIGVIDDSLDGADRDC
jgi:hypothetical protein